MSRKQEKQAAASKQQQATASALQLAHRMGQRRRCCNDTSHTGRTLQCLQPQVLVPEHPERSSALHHVAATTAASKHCSQN